MSTLKEANRKYFDAITDSYDSKPFFIKVNQEVKDHLRANLDWIGVPFANTASSRKDDQPVRLLDYACGTGFLSRVFEPYVTVTRGIDVSPGMVNTFNSRAQQASLPTSTIHAVEGDLLDKSDPTPASLSGPEWQSFDFATVGFAFHHFEDVLFAAKRLKERLRPGGVLLISDFLEGGDLKADENGEPIPGTEGNWAVHNHDHSHHHHGTEHGHSHGHSHGQGHGQGHGHGHQHGDSDHHHQHHAKAQDDVDDPSIKFRSEMESSVVVPHFNKDFVRTFFEEAGFVDVDVATMKDRVYMEFAGVKVWRTILFARGTKPFPEEGKSEL